MENNDDLFVVIIGDESEIEENNKFEAPEIKQEVIDEAEIKIKVERLLDTATEYGEVFEFDGENFNLIDDDTDYSQSQIKSEYNDDEYRENNEDYVPSDHDQSVDDEDYIPSDQSLEAFSDDNIIDTDEEFSAKSGKENAKQKNNTRWKKRTHFGKNKPREIISYVKYLRSQYPDLRTNETTLINCLVEIMKQTHRPDPPQDYFVMNGIMLECIHCAALSSSIPAAQRHYQEKHGERYLFCFACGADFRSTTNLYKHEKRCDAPDIKMVLKARALSVGRKGRSRPFLPDFSQLPPKKYNYNNNKNSIRRFECSECSASFVSKIGLLSHQHMHRGERPFRCAHCPRAYTSRATLTRHMQQHGSQEYMCDHCGRSFKLKAALILHLDTHAPLKKYPCNECHKRYSQKSALLLHVHRDHRRLPLPFACQICPKRYPRMSVLKEHMKKAHGLLIMTRKMFFKQLPVLRDTQLQQAKVVLKSADSSEPIVVADNLTDHHKDNC